MNMGSAAALLLGVSTATLGCYGGSREGPAVGETELATSDDDGGATAGDDVGDDTESDGGPDDESSASGLTGLRLLTPTQYVNSVIDVLGEADVPPTGQWRSSIAAAQGGVSPALVEAYEGAAFAVTTELFADPARRMALAGCTPASSAADDACVLAVLARIGRRAWRRPLLQSEIVRYGELAESTAALLDGDPWQGLQHAAAGLLQSPNFLYRVELGTPFDDGSRRVQLDGYEVASRLSYLVWNTTPDDLLLDAVASGELDQPEGRAAQLERLLQSPRSRDGLVQVFVDMLDLDALHSLQKDPVLLPAFTSTVGPALREELVWTIENTVLDGGDVRRLFDTDRGFVNAELAELYGVSGEFGDDFVEVDLPAGRAGLLTLGGFLAINSGEASTSPTKRGLTVRTVLMCQPIPPPPPGVEAELPEPSDNGEPMTKRDRLAQHRADPACASCHDFMDPIGLALENFDALGGWRATDNGLVIDASGELDAVVFANAAELGGALAEHPAVATCVVRNLYRYAVGHVEQPDESDIILKMNEAMTDAGYDLRQAVVALAQSEAFTIGMRSEEDSP